MPYVEGLGSEGVEGVEQTGERATAAMDGGSEPTTFDQFAGFWVCGQNGGTHTGPWSSWNQSLNGSTDQQIEGPSNYHQHKPVVPWDGRFVARMCSEVKKKGGLRHVKRAT